LRRASRHGGYGWRHDLPDPRDLMYDPLRVKFDQNGVDLRSQFPPVYSQGSLNSCSANALAGAIAFDQQRNDNVRFRPSRLFIYYVSRRIVSKNNVEYDCGASIRDSIKAVARLGVPQEKTWPYLIRQLRSKPSSQAFREAISERKTVLRSYARINQNIDMLRACLAEGYPFIFGFVVFDRFETVKSSGIISLPKAKDKPQGQHAALAVGFDNTSKCFIVRNSWGVNWGDGGYGYMPYEYIVHEEWAHDFWMLRSL